MNTQNIGDTVRDTYMPKPLNSRQVGFLMNLGATCENGGIRDDGARVTYITYKGVRAEYVCHGKFS